MDESDMGWDYALFGDQLLRGYISEKAALG